MVKIRSSEITPEHIYISRRKFMKGVGAVALGSLVLSACGSQASDNADTEAAAPTSAAPGQAQPTGSANQASEKPNSYEAITNYNNYYEFTTDKQEVAVLA